MWRKQLDSSGPLQQRGGVAVLKLRSAGRAEVGGGGALRGRPPRRGQLTRRWRYPPMRCCWKEHLPNPALHHADGQPMCPAELTARPALRARSTV